MTPHTSPRPMTRYGSLAHGVLLSLVLFLPLMRACWDQWAQTTVHLVWAFFILLGSGLILLGRSFDFSRFESAFRRTGSLWAVLLGVGLLSTLISRFSHSAYPSFLNDFPAMAFWFLAAASSDDQRSRYARGLAGAGVLAVMAALLVSADGTAPWTGPLLNPNILAALVILTGPVSLQFGFASGISRRVRIFWLAASGLLALGVLFSHSLAGYVTVAVQALMAVWILSRRKENNRWKSVLLIAAVGLLVGVGGLLARGEWPKLFHGDSDRWTWGMTALRTFAAHPFFGVGPGAFGEAYPAFRASEWGLNSLYAHNFIFEFLAERGIIGAGTLLLLIGTFFVRAKQAVDRGTGPGLFVGLVGFSLFNLFHIGFSFPALFWLFFLAAGLAETGEEIPVNGFVRRWRRTLGFSAAGLWVLIGGVSFALFRADQFLALARKAMSADHLEPARALVEAGLGWNPKSPELHELRAALRMRSQDWDGAVEDISRAVALAPASASFRIDSAELALERGDYDQALRDYETAIRLMPLKSAAWERRGDLLLGRGRTEEADRAYAGALRALTDPRVLGGDSDRRAAWTQRVENKRKELADAAKN